jgi:hypothetical protein
MPDLKPFWAEKTDTEIAEALAELSEFEPDAQRVIRSEAKRRSIELHQSNLAPEPEEPDHEPMNEAPPRRRGRLYFDLAGHSFFALVGLGFAWSYMTQILQNAGPGQWTFSHLFEHPAQLLWTAAMLGLFVYSALGIRKTLRKLGGE